MTIYVVSLYYPEEYGNASHGEPRAVFRTKEKANTYILTDMLGWMPPNTINDYSITELELEP